MRPRQPIRKWGLLLAAFATAACTPPAALEGGSGSAGPGGSPAEARGRVVPGLEVLLRDSLHLVRGKRVGFLTNQTAVTSDGRSGIDLLAASPDMKLVALYGPEHGLRGNVEGGEKVANTVDARTGVPIFSLYGSTQRPTPEMLKGVEVLLFDMQDIGARPYTFVWTMAMAMEAAAAQHIKFVVLDRPNPITSRAEGPLMDMAMRNVGQAITGYYPVPLRHGMTVGEVARYINSEYRIGADLSVVPAAGWRHDMWFDQTGMPWINPSPNIRSLEAALTYSGLVLFEATNLTVGRGTAAPFSYVGAPWLDARTLLARVAKYDMPGVTLDTATFVPTGEGWVPFKDSTVHAVRIRITDRNKYQPVWMTLVLMTEIKRLHPTRFKIENDGMTQMLGSRWAREAFDRGEEPAVIWKKWQDELSAWSATRNRYSLYK